ncbi:holo-ACP synthase [Aestuariibacter sp. AA17]|uniref:Holo-[acyl-carrier-protein] synthase n=1 Tax=Fluctibacter corallii TaxID=2984329 RepID=A0ABT3A5L0_9ALTE|nr:holo-ACP synthase [Aestuariibacter sp. AA17]MCV2883552.1 holo-ACP synthase [Aestuariibacter sp. AA17]
MAIVGIGTDIIEIGRLDAHLQKSDKLARRILTDAEFERFNSHSQPVRFLAKRFAAKEAAVKAIGIGIGNGMSWQHVEVRNYESGQPYLVFSGEFARQCELRNITSSHISISDEQHYAVATVVLEGTF